MTSGVYAERKAAAVKRDSSTGSGMAQRRVGRRPDRREGERERHGDSAAPGRPGSGVVSSTTLASCSRLLCRQQLVPCLQQSYALLELFERLIVCPPARSGACLGRNVVGDEQGQRSDDAGERRE